MPVLGGMPDPAVVTALKGSLDFYYWRGLPVVRSWPQWKGAQRSPAVAAQARSFASYIKRVPGTAPLLVDAARARSSSSNYTWRDAFVSAAWGNLNLNA